MSRNNLQKKGDAFFWGYATYFSALLSDIRAIEMECCNFIIAAIDKSVVCLTTIPFRSLSLNWVIGNIIASASWVESTAWQELSCKRQKKEENFRKIVLRLKKNKKTR